VAGSGTDVTTVGMLMSLSISVTAPVRAKALPDKISAPYPS
jgi:hypothetical protein